MAKKLTNVFAWLFTIAVTIGALAWGLYGVTGMTGTPFLLVDWIFRVDWLINTVYVLVGIAGILLIPSVLAMIFGKKRR